MKLNRVAFAAVSILLLFAVPAMADYSYDAGNEPPNPDGSYPDGSPTDHQQPCEIYGGTLDYNTGTGTFNVTIQTNFGNLASRQTYDATYGKIWRDSYTWGYGKGMADFGPGDLYIRVRMKPKVDDDGEVVADPMNDITLAVYGLVLESRTSMVKTEMANLYGYVPVPGSIPTAGATAGQLYGGFPTNVLFATGTWEKYADAFPEFPEMVDAAALPSIAPDTAAHPYDPIVNQTNLYPTILLDGALVTDSDGSNVAWNPVSGKLYKGEWDMSFALPNFNPDTMYVDVWWAMTCGNDGILIHGAETPYSASGTIIPVPGALLLCGIGMGFAGVVCGLRRRLRRS